MKSCRFAALSAVSVLALSLAAPALAADANEIEELVVTAQKREQNLQDVPIAVSAFSEAALDRVQIEDATDIQLSIPNAVLTGNDRFTLRGVGNNALAGVDPGVPTFMNGAAIGYPPQNEYFDVARIEVLRGPQGTLYGRNTTGGAINIITRKPGSEFGGDVSLQGGNHGNVRVGGAVDLPLGGVAAVRLAGYKLERDGYTKNLSTGNDVDGRDQWGARGTLTFDIGEQTDVAVVLSRFEEDSSRAREGKRLCRAHPVLGCDPRFLGFDSPDANTTILQTLSRAFTPFPAGGNIYAGAPNPTDLRKIAADTDPTYEATQSTAAFELNHDFGSITLSAIYGYSKFSTEQNTDWDNADLPFRFTRPITYFKDRTTQVTTDRLLTTDSFTARGTTKTGELRLASEFEGRFNFLVGYFGAEGTNSGGFETWHPSIELFQRALGRPQETWRVSALTRNGKSNTWALFGESYFEVTPELRLTLGARYTEEERSGEARSIVLSGLNPWVFSKFEGQKTTWKAAVDWSPDLAFTDKTLVYGSIATGYKGGGQNSSAATPTFGPETVTAYEVGTKNVLMEGALQANLTAFYYDYTGLQLGQRINGGVVTRNADATIYGLEGEFAWSVGENWLFDANVSHLHTSIGTFLSEDAANPAQSLTATTPTVQINLKGNDLPHSPGFKVKAGAQYQTAVGDGDWMATFRADATWQDSYFSREYNTPTDRIDSWGVIDLQVRLDNDAQGLSARLFVKNVTNDDNITNIIIEDALIGRYRNARLLEPRTYGVIVQKRF
ncbi:MAG: TonB-dependent receptor [Phenylobacterium sp.]|jgi:outer membrane receptor protein involved in Fe transport